MTDTGPPDEQDPGQPGWAAPSSPTTPASTPPPAAAPPSAPPGWGPPPGSPPAAPGYPGAVYAQTPPPRRKRSLAWLWALIPLLFVIIGAGIAVIILAVAFFAGPVDATNEYLDALHDGRYGAAHSMLCDTRQVSQTRADYIRQQTQAAAAGGRVVRYNINDVQFEDLITTSGRVVFSDGTDRKLTFVVRKEHGDWRICSDLLGLFGSGATSS